MTERPAPHVPVADPDLEPDKDGHAVCRCGLLILPGNPRHAMPVVPEQAEARRRVNPDDE